jgi:hypothetical protein
LNKKERERFYYDRLRIAIPSIPAIMPTEPDPPDFLITTPDIRLGIELTGFHLPPPPGKRPGQEIQSLRERVVRTAEQFYRQAGGPALYVRVMFSDNLKLSKAEVRPQAVALANVILSRRVPLSLQEPALLLESSEVPPGILHIGVSGSIDGIDKLWSVSRVFWTAKILTDHINTVIARKSRMVRVARSRCDVLWLVIVHDLFRGTPSELSEEARHSPYTAPFDKIWWLDPHGPSAIELNRINPPNE